MGGDEEEGEDEDTAAGAGAGGAAGGASASASAAAGGRAVARAGDLAATARKVPEIVARAWERTPRQRALESHVKGASLFCEWMWCLCV